MDDSGPKLPCFKCGEPATHATWIITGTKEGEARDLKLVSVCPKCYEVIKEKVRSRSRLSD